MYHVKTWRREAWSTLITPNSDCPMSSNIKLLDDEETGNIKLLDDEETGNIYLHNEEV